MGDRADRRLLPPDRDARSAPRGANSELYGGWPMVLSGLKTLLETGELLTTPGSLQYLGPEDGGNAGWRGSSDSRS